MGRSQVLVQYESVSQHAQIGSRLLVGPTDRAPVQAGAEACGLRHISDSIGRCIRSIENLARFGIGERQREEVPEVIDVYHSPMILTRPDEAHSAELLRGIEEQRRPM